MQNTFKKIRIHLLYLIIVNKPFQREIRTSGSLSHLHLTSSQSRMKMAMICQSNSAPFPAQLFFQLLTAFWEVVHFSLQEEMPC